MKTQRHIYLIAILGTLFGSFAFAGSLPGEDEGATVLLGQGLNSATGAALGNCVTLGELKTQSGNTSGQIAEFQVLEITSEESLKESLNISASASLSFGIAGGGSARMSFADSVNKNAYSRYLMVHAPGCKPN